MRRGGYYAARVVLFVPEEILVLRSNGSDDAGEPANCFDVDGAVAMFLPRSGESYRHSKRASAPPAT
jgi:hypothetical protein